MKIVNKYQVTPANVTIRKRNIVHHYNSLFFRNTYGQLSYTRNFQPLVLRETKG